MRCTALPLTARFGVRFGGVTAGEEALIENLQCKDLPVYDLFILCICATYHLSCCFLIDPLLVIGSPVNKGAALTWDSKVLSLPRWRLHTFFFLGTTSLKENKDNISWLQQDGWYSSLKIFSCCHCETVLTISFIKSTQYFFKSCYRIYCCCGETQWYVGQRGKEKNPSLLDRPPSSSWPMTWWQQRYLLI